MRNLFFRSPTKGQGEVIVGLLPIVIGTDSVHPENHFLTIVVLERSAAEEEEHRAYFVVVFIGMDQGQPGGEEEQRKNKRWSIDDHRWTFNSFN